MSLVVSDLSGDDNPDIAAALANGDDAEVAVLLGGRDGRFGAPLRYPIGNDPESIATGDFNGDGRNDLVTANINSRPVGVSVLLGVGRGRFTHAMNFPSRFAPYDLVVRDLNADDKLDIATANPGAGSVGILAGKGNGLISSTRNLPRRWGSVQTRCR